MNDIKDTPKETVAHTPGPWTVSGPVDHIVTKGDAYGHGSMMVAQVRGWGHLTGKGGGCAFSDDKAIAIQDANARLIAAAPDLLAALKELVDTTKDVEDDNLILFNARRMAQAAINKAEGRS